MNVYHVTGLMSGTSLDGLDIAFCIFTRKNDQWTYEIRAAETIPHPEKWRNRWTSLENASALDFALADAETGHYFGQLARAFHDKHHLKPDFISSHGQTIFHQPQRKMTAQIGKGPAIAAETGFPVVCDFRTTDVALGGQGAPLVPIGDQLLFAGYEYCLNLGGFGNISFMNKGKRIAFDTCPVNIVLNEIALRKGKSYDHAGSMAASGNLLPELLSKLNLLPFYSQDPPKSLGKEWVVENIFPLLNTSCAPEDLMHTFCHHAAFQIGQAAEFRAGQRMLVTGGGAFNDFLISLIRQYCRADVIIPDENTVNFKEALIFAFLGVLRWTGENNCLSSVTGARRDNTGGAVYL